MALRSLQSPPSSRPLALSSVILSFCFLFQWRISSAALLLSLKNHHRSHSHSNGPLFQSNRSTCQLFTGTWVRDDSYPMYQYSDCPFIDPEFNCQLYGRPDSGYLKYRWQPLNCELPRLDCEQLYSYYYYCYCSLLSSLLLALWAASRPFIVASFAKSSPYLFHSLKPP